MFSLSIRFLLLIHTGWAHSALKMSFGQSYQRRLSPRTQTRLSFLHQLEQGRGSPSLHSNPAPLCEGNDSCQGRQRENGWDRRTAREAATNRKSRTKYDLFPHYLSYTVNTLRWQDFLAFVFAGIWRIKDLSRAFTAAGVCAIKHSPFFMTAYTHTQPASHS